jgi:hypothetical protein
MSRRLISSLMLVSYAVSQLASCPHAHASQAVGHNQRPHLHGGWLLGALAGHGDSSPEHGHSYHRGQSHSHAHEHPASVPSTPAEPAGSDHDDDSVYLPYTLVATKVVRPAEQDGQFSRPVANCPAFAVSSAAIVSRLPQPAVPYECCGEHCALYVTLRTLRI